MAAKYGELIRKECKPSKRPLTDMSDINVEFYILMGD